MLGSSSSLSAHMLTHVHQLGSQAQHLGFAYYRGLRKHETENRSLSGSASVNSLASPRPSVEYPRMLKEV